MDYDLDRLRTALAPRLFRYLPEVSSTNDVALNWLKEGAPAGSVVIADAQMQGRGRLGRRWHAPPGTALILSVVVKPPQSALGRLTMLGAVCVAETIEAEAEQFARPDGLPAERAIVDIKWPNDVRLNGLKVCGILPEAAWEGDRLSGVALGIGLNVSVDFAGSELEGSATSIEAALGQRIDRVDLVRELLARIDFWSTRVESSALFEAWRRRLSTVGQYVTVSASGVRGIAEGIDAQGALLVRVENGTLERVIAGDIRLGE